MNPNDGISELQIPDSAVEKWQQIADLIAELIGIPAALIMRVVNTDIEVFVSSMSEGNPYQKGDKEHLIGSGLYCETVIKNKDKLLVPNALEDENWKDNPDIKLNMVSYMGFPILKPDGSAFGTICVLDKKENFYSSVAEQLIIQFRNIVEFNLQLIYMNQMLGDKKELAEYTSELKTLRGFFPICSYCKNIRNDKGYWEKIENYMTEAKFSHSICNDCEKKHFSHLDDD